MTLPFFAFVIRLRDTRNPRTFNEILDAHPKWAEHLPAEHVPAVAELYLRQNAHTRNRMLSAALEATCNPALADALLVQRPATDPLPWRGWFVRQNARNWDEVAALPKTEWVRTDRAGSDAVSVYVAHARSWGQLAEMKPRLAQLVAAGASPDGVADNLGHPLRVAASMGSPDGVAALLDTGACVNVPGVCSPLMALARHWAHPGWLPKIWRAPNAPPSVPDWESLSTVESSTSPVEQKAYRRLHRTVACWNLLVSAGADPHAFDPERSATPVQELERAFPQWGALWRARELDSPSVAAAPLPPKMRL